MWQVIFQLIAGTATLFDGQVEYSVDIGLKVEVLGSVHNMDAAVVDEAKVSKPRAHFFVEKTERIEKLEW